MSNKRIQKKRAKKREQRTWQRDKSKLIVNLIALLDSDKPRYEQWKIFKMLWNMSMEELLSLSEHVMRACVLAHSPLRNMLPRTTVIPTVDWPSVVGYHPTISNVRER